MKYIEHQIVTLVECMICYTLVRNEPAEHEYKLMGLAAYNSDKYGKEAYDIYAETLQNDGLEIQIKQKSRSLFSTLKINLRSKI